MSKRTLFAVLAAAAVAGAAIAAAGPAANAQQAKPEDYGVTEADRREGGPLLLGEFVYSQRCKVCHARTSDGRTPYGPHLEGVFGRKAAATDYDDHTQAMREAEIVWNEKNLDALLRDPQEVLPGTKMETVVRFRKSRRALIAYLKTL